MRLFANIFPLAISFMLLPPALIGILCPPSPMPIRGAMLPLQNPIA
ncbi:hypothetical protein V475_16405 [Sphingobium baderi LL03]|uniref:Uncharacterized protein n=1 Tax=Sphingobium baderi LL03 TaxID=1114964 RepID=T0GCD5_9SPHN|nr:hypothetical protein L485_11170 [Sphingobium baderi LL03]KMS60939.1 hypothetical protein V475_16405 [Sphingobium baderi LL03]